MQRGIVEFLPGHEGLVCLTCFAELAGRSSKSLKALLTQIERRYSNGVNYYVEAEGKDVFVTPDGPSDLFEDHEISTSLKSIPEEIRALVKGRNGRVVLPKNLVKKLGLPSDYSRAVAVDILGRDFASAKFGTSYLTRRSIDVELAWSGRRRPPAETIVCNNLVSMRKLFDGRGSRLNEGLPSTGSGTL